MNKIVVIGNSAAGIAAATTIRNNDKNIKIDIISDEPYHTYSRPLISYKLEGLDDEVMYYRPKDFYKKNNINPILNTKVVGIDDKNKNVITETGKKIKFDKLIIATGGVPIIPSFVPKNIEKVITFTKWDDAKYIQENLNNIQNAVVIGGGLIGIKATEGLHYNKVKVTVVELANRIMAPVIDDKASELLVNQLEENGVEVKLNVSAEEIKKNYDKVVVVLSDGTKITTNIVIVAVGVRPNIDLVKNTSIKTGKGIITNSKQETSVKDIYAAGDCAEGKEIISGDNKLLPLWPNAYHQGLIAGLNAIGKDIEDNGCISMNSVEIFGLPSISAGIVNPPDDKKYEILEKYELSKKIYKKIVLKDNIIVGYIFLNEIDRAGIFTGILKEKVDVTEFKDKLLNENFGYISFPKDVRKTKLYVYYEV